MTYKARDYLRACLLSLTENTHIDYEVVVVDNGSKDGTCEMLVREFPEVHLIENERNEGYTRAMNQALKSGQGRYLLQLNPDTLILPGALDELVRFMDENLRTGICGPKVLNIDHSLQKSCRRGESTPWAVITYFSGLAALFPRSKCFAQYHMSYMDEDTIHPVAGVSGSCMLIRRALVEQIGYLDERFFAYQEDADYCYRARQAGWQVIYNPRAKIIHFGGQGGSGVEPLRSKIEWHRSYFLYYRKNLAGNYPFLFNGLYYIAMFIKLGLTVVITLLKNQIQRRRRSI